MSEQCPMCCEAYGAGRPSSFGSDPKCAFRGGEFSADNWNCATANAIREHTFQDGAESRALYEEEDYAALLPWHGRGWLLVSWYKHRGRTDQILIFDGHEARAITLAEAQEYVATMASELPEPTHD